MDNIIFSKLQVVKEDIDNKTLILKPETNFIYYLLNQHYRGILEPAFRAQGFTFKLLEVDNSN